MRVLSIAAALAAAVGIPTVFYASPAMPNDTVVLLGAGLSNVSNVTICWLSTMGCLNVPPVMNTNWSSKFIVPAGIRSDTYKLTVCDDSGCSSDIVINTPDIWWTQTDSLVNNGTVFNNLGRIMISGQTLWVDINARTCNSVVSYTNQALALQDASGTLYRLPAAATCFHIEATVDSTAPPGTYTLLVNNGIYAGNGLVIGTMVVAAPPAPGSASCQANTVDDIQPCLTSVGDAGGGTVFLASGLHSMPVNEAIVVPNNTLLVGFNPANTILLWANNPPNNGTPGALITGTGAWGIANLTVRATSGVHNAVLFGSTCNGCSATGIVIDVNTTAYPTVFPHNPWTASQAINWRFANNTVRYYGSCNASWPGNCAWYVAQSTNGFIEGNYWESGCQGYSHDSSSALHVINNTMVSRAVVSDGNGYSSFNSPWSMDNVYAGGNTQYGNPAAQRAFESMTFDGPGSLTVGNVLSYFVNASGAFVTVQQSVKSSMPGFAPGMLVAVMQGTGIGQVRRAVANPVHVSTGAPVYQLESPLDVPLDGTSIVSVVAYKARMIWENNIFINGTTVQLFGTSIDCVFSGNQLYNMTAGILGWGRMYQGGWQPSYRVLFQENTLKCCGQMSTFSSTEPTPVPPFNFTGPFNMAQIHRRNQLTGGTKQAIKGASWDSVVEGNVLAADVCTASGNGPLTPSGTLYVDPASLATFVRQ